MQKKVKINKKVQKQSTLKYSLRIKMQSTGSHFLSDPPFFPPSTVHYLYLYSNLKLLIYAVHIDNIQEKCSVCFALSFHAHCAQMQRANQNLVTYFIWTQERWYEFEVALHFLSLLLSIGPALFFSQTIVYYLQ